VQTSDSFGKEGVNFLSKLEKHLNADEKVLWNGKPVKAPFLFPALAISFVIGLFFVIIGIFMYYVLSITPPPDVPPESTTLVVLLLVIPGLAIIVGAPLWQFMRYRNTEYLITDQRIITQTGAIGLDTRFVDLDKVQEVYVKVGVIDKLFGTGSVIAVTAGRIHVGMERPSLKALKEPYEVQKLLQEAMKKAQTTEKE
jgi:uncharacterized membrane protein YdbT with pleckstrin-like domain